MLLVKECSPGCENNMSFKIEADNPVVFSVKNEKGRVEEVDSSLSFEYGSQCPVCGMPTKVVVYN